jgi:hypothetical protein
MDGIDLNRFVFDYDLTFAALLMNADGTVYHRFGGRDYKSADTYLSMPALVKLMKETLSEHAEYQKKPSPPKGKPKRTINDIPAFAKKPKPKCVHCHMVNDSERSTAQQKNQWSKDDIWLWPLPDRVGFKVDPADPAVVLEVSKGSAADQAGVKKGDRLAKFGSMVPRSLHDYQFVLEFAPKESATIPFEIDGGKKGDLKLKKGWRAGDPLDLSWRPSMWGLSPQTGFGGKRLTPDELKKEGLPEDAFAFRVGYIVDWGDKAYLGKNVKGAGIQKGDIVLSVEGKNDFFNEMHFQTWFRLTLRPGMKVKVELLRGGKRQTAMLPVVE